MLVARKQRDTFDKIAIVEPAGRRPRQQTVQMDEHMQETAHQAARWMQRPNPDTPSAGVAGTG